jgi:hypothetical protein
MTQQTALSCRSDAGLIHASTRTLMATNADPAGRSLAVTKLRMTRLEIRQVSGEVSVRFSAHASDVTPARSRARGVR